MIPAWSKAIAKNPVTRLLGARARALPGTFWLLVGGAIAPVLLAFRIQIKNWVNIPIWDEWDTPGTALLHHAQGMLTWSDLFAQHNESRKFVPRLIHLAIASVSGWDVRQGMVLTFVCACAVSACALLYLCRSSNRSVSQVLFPWLLVNVLLFAPSQYENFLSGFVFEIYIPFLCLFGCCAVNLSRWPLPAKVVCNSFLALVATYTFAHGILVWAFAIPIPIREGHSRRPRFFLAWYAAYFAIGILSIACYFIGYRRPEVAPPPATPAQVVQVLEFIVFWLGAVVRSSCVNPRFSGALVGLIVTLALIGAFAVLRQSRERWRVYYSWLLLLGFALSSGAVTAVGRVNLGIDNVFNTFLDGFSGMRYNVTSVFAYVAVIGLVFSLYEDRIRSQPVLRNRFLTALTVCCTLVAVAWIELFSEESTRVKQFQANRRRARTAIIWINALPENPEILRAYPYPDGFWQRVEAMRAAGWLRLPKVSESLRQTIDSAPGDANGEAGFLDFGESRPNEHVRFAGWARDPVKHVSADYVVLGWQQADGLFHPLTAIRAGQVRPDVAKACGPRLLKAGFDQEIDLSKLPAGLVTIKGWAIDWDTQQAFPVKGAVQLDRPRS